MNRHNTTLFAIFSIFVFAACGSTPSNPTPDVQMQMDASMDNDAVDVQMPTDNVMPPVDTNPTDVPSDRARDMAGGVCRPSEADPMCTMGSYSSCECDMSSPGLMAICAMNPTMCAMVSTCTPGRNHCGINLPPDQMYEPFQRPDCIARLDLSVWAIDGREHYAGTQIVNGQFFFNSSYSTSATIRSGWTCSGDRCWGNWGNMATDIHSWVRFPQEATGCVAGFIETFPPGVDGRTGAMPTRSVQMSWLRRQR